MGSKITKRKIYSRVTPETYRRLEKIKDSYGFKSVYEIVQNLIHCFLRVADRENDQQIDPLPYEVERMFDELSEGEKHVEFERKYKRRASAKSVNNE